MISSRFRIIIRSRKFKTTVNGTIFKSWVEVVLLYNVTIEHNMDKRVLHRVLKKTPSESHEWANM